MKALITGASSGIGREIALYLSDLGYDIIVVARDELGLRDIQREVKTKVEIVTMDLTDRENVWKLHEMYKKEPIEVLVNNAGFGVHGYVTETDLEKDLELIDLNIAALHMLTKLFLKDMKRRNLGYIFLGTVIGLFYMVGMLNSGVELTQVNEMTNTITNALLGVVVSTLLGYFTIKEYAEDVKYTRRDKKKK